MAIGYQQRGESCTSCSMCTTNQVDKYIGTAYSKVKCVADNIDHIVGVSMGTQAPILVAPNGVRYCLTVDNAGTLCAQAISSGDE